MAAWRGRRPLKRWTWVGAFGPELMLCAAVARIGPATAAWWAVWDGATFTERSLRRRAGIVVEPSRVAALGAGTRRGGGGVAGGGGGGGGGEPPPRGWGWPPRAGPSTSGRTSAAGC